MSNRTDEQVLTERLDDAVAELRRVVEAMTERQNKKRVVEKKGLYGYSVYIRSAR